MLILLITLFYSFICTASYDLTVAAREPAGLSVHLGEIDAPSADSSGDLPHLPEPIEDRICNAALHMFAGRTDSDLSRYIRPHLRTIVKEATTSPDSDDDSSPSPKRTVRRLAQTPDSIRTMPRRDIDEVVLSAVQKAVRS